MKNYKEAKSDLKVLTERFPDNDKYRNWLAATQTYSTQTFINILWYIIAAVVIVTALFDREDIGVFYDVILYSGAVALVTAATAEIIKAVRKRRIKKQQLTGVQEKAGRYLYILVYLTILELSGRKV